MENCEKIDRLWCNYHAVYTDIPKAMIAGFHIVRDWGEFGACWTFATKSKIAVHEKIGDQLGDHGWILFL